MDLGVVFMLLYDCIPDKYYRDIRLHIWTKFTNKVKLIDLKTERRISCLEKTNFTFGIFELKKRTFPF